MKTTFDEIISDVLAVEGGFVDNPLDRGGRTNFGITLSTLSAYLQRRATNEEVADLTVDIARQIYKEVFWDSARVDEIPDNLKAVYFDAVVNHGQGGAVLILQVAANSIRQNGDKISEDKIIGPNTIRAAHNSWLTAEMFVAYRILYHAAIVLGGDLKNRSDQEAFWLGWLRRDQKGLE